MEFEKKETDFDNDNSIDGDSNGVLWTREWCMPSPNTFSIGPIKKLLKRHISENAIVIDPFSRDSEWGTITNDLNPKTNSQYHMEAVSFLDMLIENNQKLVEKGKEPVLADVVLLDPPYSPRQISECYEQIGKKASSKDTQNARLYSECADRLTKLLKEGGKAIRFGWNSGGFGKSRGYVLKEILMVAHGGAHNDTIVTVEIKGDPPTKTKKRVRTQ
jgi:hypothetical protein